MFGGECLFGTGFWIEFLSMQILCNWILEKVENSNSGLKNQS